MRGAEADLDWAAALRAGETAAWARFGREVEPRLPFLPGHHPARHTAALRRWLRTGQGGAPAPLAAYAGRVPLVPWVLAESILLQEAGGRRAPVEPVAARVAAEQSAACLLPFQRRLLGQRYCVPASPFEAARREAAARNPSHPLLAALVQTIEHSVERLDPELSRREREDWLAGQAVTAGDALVRSLESRFSRFERHRPAGHPEAAGLFRHLGAESLAGSLCGGELPLEERAHLTACSTCRQRQVWLERAGAGRRRSLTGLAAAFAAAAGSLALLAALLWGGAVLAQALRPDPPAWAVLTAAAEGAGASIPTLADLQREARQAPAASASGVAIALPRGRTYALPGAAVVLGTDPSESLRLRIGPGGAAESALEFSGLGRRVPLLGVRDAFPRDADLVVELVEPVYAATARSVVRLVTAEEQALYEDGLRRLLAATPHGWRDAARVAAALGDRRDGEAYAQAFAAWGEGPSRPEEWLLRAVAARRAGDRTLWKAAQARLED